MSVNEWYLQRILWGKMRISASRLSGCLADGFLWLDYVSIPQANHDLQMQAVASIGAFIAHGGLSCSDGRGEPIALLPTLAAVAIRHTHIAQPLRERAEALIHPI